MRRLFSQPRHHGMNEDCSVPAAAGPACGDGHSGGGRKSLPEQADRRRDGFRKAGMVLRMVFQMPVRRADSGGNTGSASDREKQNLFHTDYHKEAVLDGFPAWGGVPAEGQDDFHWKKPIWRKGDTAGSMRTGAESGRKAEIRPPFSHKVQHHGAVFPDSLFGMPPQHPEHEAHSTGKCTHKRRNVLL